MEHRHNECRRADHQRAASRKRSPFDPHARRFFDRRIGAGDQIVADVPDGAEQLFTLLFHTMIPSPARYRRSFSRVRNRMDFAVFSRIADAFLAVLAVFQNIMGNGAAIAAVFRIRLAERTLFTRPIQIDNCGILHLCAPFSVCKDANASRWFQDTV